MNARYRAAAAPTTAAAGKAAPSLTLRLTLLFAAASALVLFLLGIVLGRAMERHFEEQDMAVLAGKLELARHMLEKDRLIADPAAMEHQFDDALTGHHNLIVVVRDAAGKTLYASAALDPPSALLTGAAAPVGRPLKWRAADGTPWRGIAGTAGERREFVVAAATEISHHEQFLDGFRRTLWLFVALAVLATGLLGWAAVRRGLAPLQAIKAQAAEVTADRLDTRLPTAAIPAELVDVVASLNGMLARLEASFRRLSDFSSDLAHELRTPVSNLLTQTQVTLAKARSEAEYRDILASNAEELEHLSRMIADMLFLAKADNDQWVPNRERIDLAAEVAGLIEFFEAVAEEKGVALSAAGAATVVGDRLMLRRALGNLLSNALRHTPPNGRVAVTIAAAAEHVEVAVENDGPDIPAEHLPRLFDRFYRADAARHGGEGAGLGLAIVRSIARAHGGEVSVVSGGGATRFTLSLPVAAE